MTHRKGPKIAKHSLICRSIMFHLYDKTMLLIVSNFIRQHKLKRSLFSRSFIYTRSHYWIITMMMVSVEINKQIKELRDFEPDNPHTSLFLSRDERVSMIKAGQGYYLYAIQKEIFIQKGYTFVEF